MMLSSLNQYFIGSLSCLLNGHHAYPTAACDIYLIASFHDPLDLYRIQKTVCVWECFRVSLNVSPH